MTSRNNTYTHIHVCMCIYMYTCVYTYIYIYIHIQYIYIYIYRYTLLIYIYIYIYIYILQFLTIRDLDPCGLVLFHSRRATGQAAGQPARQARPVRITRFRSRGAQPLKISAGAKQTVAPIVEIVRSPQTSPRDKSCAAESRDPNRV